MTQAPPDLYSVGQAARQWGLSHRAALHRITKGQIAATKIGSGRTSGYVITGAEVERIRREIDARAS